MIQLNFFTWLVLETRAFSTTNTGTYESWVSTWFTILGLTVLCVIKLKKIMQLKKSNYVKYAIDGV